MSLRMVEVMGRWGRWLSAAAAAAAAGAGAAAMLYATQKLFLSTWAGGYQGTLAHVPISHRTRPVRLVLAHPLWTWIGVHADMNVHCSSSPCILCSYDS
eukprot:207508-Pelagomonas_calceolata.AAC.3